MSHKLIMYRTKVLYSSSSFNLVYVISVNGSHCNIQSLSNESVDPNVCNIRQPPHPHLFPIPTYSLQMLHKGEKIKREADGLISPFRYCTTKELRGFTAFQSSYPFCNKYEASSWKVFSFVPNMFGNYKGKLRSKIIGYAE